MGCLVRKMLIYRITNRVNGRQYVGRTIQGLRTRWQKHVRSAIRNDHPRIALHSAIRKYGPDAFCVEVLAKLQTNTDLLDAERLFIWAHRQSNIRLYNLTAGGDGSLGLKHSTETKEKIRQIALSQNLTVTSPLRTPCTIEGLTFPSRIDAASYFGVERHTISKWIKTGVKGNGRWPKLLGT